MLPGDLPFKPRTALARVAGVLLGEPLLGFLAIVAGGLSLVPVLFRVSPAGNRLLEAAQWLIVVWFAVEYGLGLAWAPDKPAFVRNPWRVLDLSTVLLPLVTLLPAVSNLLRSSPVLRLLRLLRVVALGARASGVAIRQQVRRAAEAVPGPVELSVLATDRSATPVPASWGELLQWFEAPGARWFHVSSPGPDEVQQIVRRIGLQRAEVEAHLWGTSYPRLQAQEGAVVLFTWLPELQPVGPPRRNGLVAVATGNGLLTVSRHRTGLLDSVASRMPKMERDAQPFPVRMMAALWQAVLDRYEQWLGHCEQELRALEEVPVRESRPGFFEQCFRLKNELFTAQSDLWRLKGILSALAEGRVRLLGGSETAPWRRLEDAASYLYETAVNTREGTLSLIELHLNVVSFEMNRVMRVLAVVSVLGLIPAVIGGLLGMNLADNPWPFTLPQVAFVVGLGMVLCLYLFVVKGWLR